MPEFDDNAAAFFGITVLALYLVPATIYIFSSIRKSRQTKASDVPKGRTSVETKKLERLAKEEASKEILWTQNFKTFVIVTGVLGLLFIYLLWSSSGNKELAAYDPFVILGLSSGATEGEIKKAYRSLSKIHHPDLQGGSNEMFQKIAKAYETLTDETARANYEKYGNPDGPKALEVSIGLPSWIMKGFAQYAVLFIYLGILVVGVPIFMFRSYRKRAAATNKVLGVDQATIAWCVLRMNTHGPQLTAASVPEILAGAKENAELLPQFPPPANDFEELKSLAQSMSANKEMPSFPKLDRAVIAPDLINVYFILLHAYLNRKVVNSPLLRKIQNGLLVTAEKVFDVLVQYCMEQNMMNMRQEEAKKKDKNLKIPKDKVVANHTNALLNILEAKQQLYQALSSKDSSLRTVLFPEDVKHISTLSKKTGRADNLLQYLRLPAELRYFKGKDMSQVKDAMEKAQIFYTNTITTETELNNVIKDLPDLDITAKIYVQGYDNIAEGDICTLDLVLARQGVTETSKDVDAPAPVAFTPYWPVAKDEEWNILLIDEWNRIVKFEIIKEKEFKKYNKLSYMFPAPDKAGPHQYRLLIKSGTYYGLDQEIPIHIEVSPPAVAPADNEHVDKEKSRDKKNKKASNDDDDDEEDNEKPEGAAGGIAGAQSLIDGYLMGAADDESDVSDDDSDDDKHKKHSHSHSHSHGDHGHSHGEHKHDDNCSHDDDESEEDDIKDKASNLRQRKVGNKKNSSDEDTDDEFNVPEENTSNKKKSKKAALADAKRKEREAKKAAANLAGGMD